MATDGEHSNLHKSVRQGTAQRRPGKATAARLVETAYEILESENLDRFSMRKVAERAGVSLANLQYYFPTRNDLAHALFLYVGARYKSAYDACTAAAPADPVERLKAVLRFNLQDITQPSTRRFFMQFWALIGAMDDFAGRHLGELYAIDIDQLSEHIRPLQPELPESEIRRRAVMIAGLTEGLTVVLGDDVDGSVVETALQLMVDIATG